MVRYTAGTDSFVNILDVCSSACRASSTTACLWFFDDDAIVQPSILRGIGICKYCGDAIGKNDTLCSLLEHRWVLVYAGVAELIYLAGITRMSS